MINTIILVACFILIASYVVYSTIMQHRHRKRVEYLLERIASNSNYMVQ
jgi:hypothetical protein